VSEQLAGQWISVSERLPEDDVDVLGFWIDEEDSSNKHLGGCSLVFRKDGKWFFADDNKIETGTLWWPYTHWMPLPQSPWAQS
jgi:hypothetical protein